MLILYKDYIKFNDHFKSFTIEYNWKEIWTKFQNFCKQKSDRFSRFLQSSRFLRWMLIYPGQLGSITRQMADQWLIKKI